MQINYVENTFEKYKESMKEELDFFYINNVIKKIDRTSLPMEEVITPSKWVLSEKLDPQSMKNCKEKTLKSRCAFI